MVRVVEGKGRILTMMMLMMTMMLMTVMTMVMVGRGKEGGK